MGEFHTPLSAAMVEWLSHANLENPAAVAVSNALQEVTKPPRIVIRVACGVDVTAVQERYRQCVATLWHEKRTGDTSAFPDAFGHPPELVVEQGWVRQELGDVYCAIRRNHEYELEEELTRALQALEAIDNARLAELRQSWLRIRLDQIACCLPEVREAFEELQWMN